MWRPGVVQLRTDFGGFTNDAQHRLEVAPEG
jgi:hypothetical protein